MKRMVRMCVTVLLLGTCTIWAQDSASSPAETRPATSQASFKYDNPHDLYEDKDVVLSLWAGDRKFMGHYDSGEPYIHYLDHPDPEMRAAAEDIISRTKDHLDPKLFIKYTSSKYPLQIRFLALSFLVGEAETGSFENADPKMRDEWRKVMNDAIAGPVSPPHFDRFVYRMSLASWIDAQNHQICVRRLLAAMDTLQEKYPSPINVFNFSVDAWAPEMRNWYANTSNVQARNQALANIPGGTPERRAGSLSLLEIAKEDWSEDNRELAKSLIAKYKASDSEYKNKTKTDRTK